MDIFIDLHSNLKRLREIVEVSGNTSALTSITGEEEQLQQRIVNGLSRFVNTEDLKNYLFVNNNNNNQNANSDCNQRITSPNECTSQDEEVKEKMMTEMMSFRCTSEFLEFQKKRMKCERKRKKRRSKFQKLKIKKRQIIEKKQLRHQSVNDWFDANTNLLKLSLQKQKNEEQEKKNTKHINRQRNALKKQLFKMIPLLYYKLKDQHKAVSELIPFEYAEEGVIPPLKSPIGDGDEIGDKKEEKSEEVEEDTSDGNVNKKSRLVVENPYFPTHFVTEYFSRSERSLDALINIRREWDAYIVNPDVEGASRIPQHFISPPSSPSESWAAYLVEDTKNQNMNINTHSHY